MTQLPPYMTTAQVAVVLDVDQRTVMRWAKKGKITATKMPGGWYRIPGSAVAPFLISGTTPDAGPVAPSPAPAP